VLSDLRRPHETVGDAGFAVRTSSSSRGSSRRMASPPDVVAKKRCFRIGRHFSLQRPLRRLSGS
jgi:hypothetical protein